MAARFDKFERPKRVRVPDVRGGSIEFTAVGQLVFRLKGEELRLTAIAAKGQPRLSVWFKDQTNGSTTYRGYRTVRPQVVSDGEWTVIVSTSPTIRRAPIPISPRARCRHLKIGCQSPLKQDSSDCRRWKAIERRRSSPFRPRPTTDFSCGGA